MELKDIGFFILITFALTEFIAFIVSMITYYNILHGIQNDPMNPQNILNFENWLVEFLKGQVYGLPISVIITSIGYLLMGRRPEF